MKLIGKLVGCWVFAVIVGGAYSSLSSYDGYDSTELTAAELMSTDIG